jgi:ATP-binding cassette, subfamily F, member 3
MAVLLQILDGVKSYGDQALLDGASATIHDGTKIGFIGRNGAGKSTLLRILLGEEELDSGEIVRGSHLKVGYLRQHDPFHAGESALDFLMRDSEQPDWKCGEVAGEFELKGDYLNGPVNDLSGGWQTRVKLAALLLHEPNLLMLDEPTNFLDLRTQILLEHFLVNFTASCLIVSHDRAFLTATCDQTLDLNKGKLTLYNGKVGPYLEKIEEDKIRDERTNAAVLSKQKQLQKFIDKNKARATSASQARSKQKQLDRLHTKEIEVDLPTASIKAPVVEPRQGPAVLCMDLAIGYADHTVASDISVEVEHQQRAAIVGDNGQGKTTFLRTLVDSLKPMQGKVKWGFGCKIGTYAQHVYSTLPQDQTVLEYLEYNSMPGVTTQDCLGVAGALLFRGAHVQKPIKVLSGGERARLCMAGLLLGDYNILILDEPGNHLDVETVEALASALLKYKGTVLFTSHDRHFVKRIATNVIEVKNGRARNYNGDYDAYVYSVNKEVEEGERERTGNKLAPPPAAKIGSSKAKTELSGKDHHNARKQLRNLEKTIARLDNQRKELSAEMLTTSDAKKSLALHNQIASIQQELSESEEKWCELSQELGDW